MEITQHTTEILGLLKKIPEHKLQLKKSKKKTFNNPSTVSITLIDSYEKFKTELNIIITNQKPFFYCYFCKQNLCYHITYLLINKLMINDTNLISLYTLWDPKFVEKIIESFHTLEFKPFDLHTELLKISSDICCPICLESLENDMMKTTTKRILMQCEKCLKPTHITCWNTWMVKHKKDQRNTLKCLHCHS
jgi:hypothetical protein